MALSNCKTNVGLYLNYSITTSISTGAECPGLDRHFYDYLISTGSMVIEIVILLVSIVFGCKFKTEIGKIVQNRGMYKMKREDIKSAE